MKKYHGLKKMVVKDFDPPMGCFDGVEVCELVTFILNKLKNAFQNNTFGLYRLMCWQLSKVYLVWKLRDQRKMLLKYPWIVDEILQLK